MIEISQTPQQYSLTNSVNSSTLNTNYSIPNLLFTLQNEWDAVMLENFQLRQQLDLCKKELSTALYRYDAAVRVASKASKERDDLKQELTHLTKIVGSDKEETCNKHIDSPELNTKIVNQQIQKNQKHISVDMIHKMAHNSQEYVKMSKIEKRKIIPVTKFGLKKEKMTFDKGAMISENLPTCLSSRVICIYDETNISIIKEGIETTYPMEIEKNAYIYPVDDKNIFYATTSKICTYSFLSKQLLEKENDLQGKVCFIAYLPYIHEDYFVTVSKDGVIVFNSISSTDAYQLNDYKFKTTSADLHKDGLLLALGNSEDGIIIHNFLKPNDPPIQFPYDYNIDGNLLGVKFAPNGYWMYVISDKSIKVYDLRKTPGTLAVDSLMFQDKVHGYTFDHTGRSMFLVASSGVITWYTFDKLNKNWKLELSSETFSDFQKFCHITYMQCQDSTCLKAIAASTDETKFELYTIYLNS